MSEAKLWGVYPHAHWKIIDHRTGDGHAEPSGRGYVAREVSPGVPYGRMTPVRTFKRRSDADKLADKMTFGPEVKRDPGKRSRSGLLRIDQRVYARVSTRAPGDASVLPRSYLFVPRGTPGTIVEVAGRTAKNRRYRVLWIGHKYPGWYDAEALLSEAERDHSLTPRRPRRRSVRRTR